MLDMKAYQEETKRVWEAVSRLPGAGAPRGPVALVRREERRRVETQGQGKREVQVVLDVCPPGPTPRG